MKQYCVLLTKSNQYSALELPRICLDSNGDPKLSLTELGAEDFKRFLEYKFGSQASSVFAEYKVATIEWSEE